MQQGKSNGTISLHVLTRAVTVFSSMSLPHSIETGRVNISVGS